MKDISRIFDSGDTVTGRLGDVDFTQTARVATGKVTWDGGKLGG